MIKFHGRYEEYCYRVSSELELDEKVATLNEGQWITRKGGKAVIADSTSTKAFLCITSKRKGRDQLSGKTNKLVSFLHGSFYGLAVDQFDAAGSYGEMTPLKLKEGGILTPWLSASDKDYQIVAYAIDAPKGGFLTICSR